MLWAVLFADNTTALVWFCLNVWLCKCTLSSSHINIRAAQSFCRKSILHGAVGKYSSVKRAVSGLVPCFSIFGLCVCLKPEQYVVLGVVRVFSECLVGTVSQSDRSQHLESAPLLFSYSPSCMRTVKNKACLLHSHAACFVSRFIHWENKEDCLFTLQNAIFPAPGIKWLFKA